MFPHCCPEIRDREVSKLKFSKKCDLCVQLGQVVCLESPSSFYVKESARDIWSWVGCLAYASCLHGVMGVTVGSVRFILIRVCKFILIRVVVIINTMCTGSVLKNTLCTISDLSRGIAKRPRNNRIIKMNLIQAKSRKREYNVIRNVRGWALISVGRCTKSSAVACTF